MIVFYFTSYIIPIFPSPCVYLNLWLKVNPLSPLSGIKFLSGYDWDWVNCQPPKNCLATHFNNSTNFPLVIFRMKTRVVWQAQSLSCSDWNFNYWNIGDSSNKFQSLKLKGWERERAIIWDSIKKGLHQHRLIFFSEH